MAAAIDDLQRRSFDARVDVDNLTVGDGAGAGEFVFVGVHTGDFAGLQATGQEVRVPYAVFFDLSGGLITALRAYGFASGLTAHLAAVPSPAP